MPKLPPNVGEGGTTLGQLVQCVTSSSSRVGGALDFHRDHCWGWIRAVVRVWPFEQLGGPKSTNEAGDLIQPNRRLLAHCVLDTSLQLGGAL